MGAGGGEDEALSTQPVGGWGRVGRGGKREWLPSSLESRFSWCLLNEPTHQKKY